MLGIDPLTGLVTQGSEFLITVYVSSGQERFDGVQVVLRFDPAYLQAVEIVPGDGLPFVFPFPQAMPKGYDNAAGRIIYAAGAGLGVDSPSGRADLFSVRFEAMLPTSGSLIEFVDDVHTTSTVVVSAANPLGLILVPMVVTIVSDGRPTPTSTPTLPPPPTPSPYPSLAPRYRVLRSPLPLVLKPWPGDR